LSSCRRGPPPRRDFAIIWPVGYLNAHTRATGPAGIRRQYARAALTGLELAAGLGEALGEKARYDAVSPDTYRALGFPGAAELGNMFQFKRDFQDVSCGARSVEFSRSLNPCLQTFERWLCANKRRIPLG